VELGKIQVEIVLEIDLENLLSKKVKIQK